MLIVIPEGYRLLVGRDISDAAALMLDHELTEEMAEALYEAGCDDGTPGTCGGVGSIVFHREADSLEAAIKSASAKLIDP